LIASNEISSFYLRSFEAALKDLELVCKAYKTISLSFFNSVDTNSKENPLFNDYFKTNFL